MTGPWLVPGFGIGPLVQRGRDLRVAKRNPYSRWRQASARLPVRGAQASGAQRGAAADHHLPAGRRPGSGRDSGREGRRAHHPGILRRAPGPGHRGRAGQGSHGRGRGEARTAGGVQRGHGRSRLPGRMARAIRVARNRGRQTSTAELIGRRGDPGVADLDWRKRSRDASGTGGCRPGRRQRPFERRLFAKPSSTANRPRGCWSASNRRRG